MKDKDKYQEQRDYTHGWNLDALPIERHMYVPKHLKQGLLTYLTLQYSQTL
jgi:hypothetical protein